ncbi:hypothetical protein [Dyadobacter luticola]|uniref:Outer membrane protein beta-barrel domain-containing protein n=1 Tax=Dyadobacter luticola TaxID=1979387 RepID=A0A5R9KVG2_9BACT|nr:hypothetical protein [Dyadobacter luticola]TLV00148.1 hypothetical protein FEN17_11610 [Dyadobacter luticola]
MRPLILLFSLLAICAHAQQTWRKPSTNGISSKKSYIRKDSHQYSLTFRGGLTQFFGELGDQDMRSVIGVSLGKNFIKNFALHLDYNAGKVGGEKQAFFNSYFINEFITIECLAKWNLTEQFNRLEPGPVNFFIYGGLGQIYFSANAFNIDDDKLLRFTNSQLSARNRLFLRWGPAKGPTGIKKTREGILPLGTCLEYELLPNCKLGIDYRFYFVRTDKMDATSGRRLINPEESDSYSDTPNDKFSFLSLSLTCRFGKPK